MCYFLHLCSCGTSVDQTDTMDFLPQCTCTFFLSWSIQCARNFKSQRHCSRRCRDGKKPNGMMSLIPKRMSRLYFGSYRNLFRVSRYFSSNIMSSRNRKADTVAVSVRLINLIPVLFGSMAMACIDSVKIYKSA